MDKKLLFEVNKPKRPSLTPHIQLPCFMPPFFCDVLYITVYGYSYIDEEIMLKGFDKMKSELYLLNLQGTYREQWKSKRGR